MITEFDAELDVTIDDVQVRVAAVGGGTLGRTYRGQGWFYSLTIGGEHIVSGRDLSGPTNHLSAVFELLEFVAGDSDGTYGEMTKERVGWALDKMTYSAGELTI